MLRQMRDPATGGPGRPVRLLAGVVVVGVVGLAAPVAIDVVAPAVEWVWRTLQ